jgi:3-oxoadipate enol-lactonase
LGVGIWELGVDELMDRLIESSGARISYTVEGPSDCPVLLFINSIGTTRDLWLPQVPALVGTYRVIRYDARGHGSSSVPEGDYSIAQLGRDALAILDAEGARQAHICGISLGGLTAMWLGVNASDRVSSLVLANTAARIGSVQSWNDRIALVKERGMRGVAEMAIHRWFSPGYRQRHDEVVTQYKTMVESCPTAGYLGCCAALRDEDLREAISAIKSPVLVVAGSTDEATPPEGLRFIHERIAGSKMLTLDAAHLSNVEQAEAFTSAVMGFLGSI